ncbi:amidase [Actinoallomurus soli]|uniref:amidase n=1 Tax=Actinoallomurus soli TaxID=2952535 RepID=UPI0020930B54|nr:amidase [Actinoallomurus soli]MCO5972852.1 amidase [Actinoallomurus soli]
MATWMMRLDDAGDGPRLAVKDAMDIKGTPTSAGSPAIADRAEPAAADAAVVAVARSQGARIVGKTNLTELCLGADGVNPWFGTPVNPLDPSRVPGGSSSGSAVAVATGEADVAFGTDTAGSVRVPAACCGIASLKTTYGRVPRDGVHPLAPSVDTIGPMARDVAGVTLGMRLIEPGFAPTPYDPAMTVGRLRIPGVAEPAIDAAVDTALRRAFTVVDETCPHFVDAVLANGVIVGEEAYRQNGHLLADSSRLSDRIYRRLNGLYADAKGKRGWAEETRRAIRAELDNLFRRHAVLALPVLPGVAPTPPAGDDDLLLCVLTAPFNLAGLPAFALPVPLPGSHLPAAVQLVGPAGSEELLCGAAAALEAAVS